eukprot:GGOE01019360.1.p1 GENE.GGOE01019360.1~~GGOE01019360.1.p1  ORF type:complete len:413 (+),score=61.48 GGOE01019360.1:112-1350(+)
MPWRWLLRWLFLLLPAVGGPLPRFASGNKLPAGWSALHPGTGPAVCHNVTQRVLKRSDIFAKEGGIRRDLCDTSPTKCSLMSKCFNMSRCRNFTVYVYRVTENTRQWGLGLGVKFQDSIAFNAYMETANDLSKANYPYHTDDPHSACVLLVSGMPTHINGDLRGKKTMRWLLRLPYWNFGKNHIILDNHDVWSLGSEIPHAAHPVGDAIVFKSSVRHHGQRRLFDVPTALPPQKRYSTAQRFRTPPNRTLLACWKGEPNTCKRVRTAILKLHNGRDLIMVANRQPRGVDYDFLMEHCRFVLAPRGIGLHSFRLLEILAAGAVPVVLADGVLPFQHLFDWSQFAMHVPEARVGAVPRLVRAVSQERWRQMQLVGACMFERFFSDIRRMLILGLETVRTRVEAVRDHCRDAKPA